MTQPSPPPRGLKQALRAIPLLGPLLAWCNALLRLPQTRAEQARLAARLDALTATPAAPAGMDAFYVAFEDRFRGSREDIKNRLRVYLPRLAALPRTGDNAVLAVDIGCGRGEWLELMKENGIAALGIDSNTAMVEACMARGLPARCADAVAFLQAQPANSLALVSGFHIIEHIPFAGLVALFDAALHALQPGGCLLFETPNPENLSVGACTFHIDPTHLKPIVPDVAEFMARQRGFARAEILRLHPFPDNEQLSGGAAEALLNKSLLGSRDYAVIAWKG